VKSLVLCLLAAVATLGACGDDNPTLTPDSGNPMPDAPNPQANFTSYVIDLVMNQTSDTTSARAYAEFEALPDPDADNATAYASLFQ
jgi:hypothetical protein